MKKSEEIKKLKKDVELWQGRAESYEDAFHLARENYERIIEDQAITIKFLRTKIVKCTCDKKSS